MRAIIAPRWDGDLNRAGAILQEFKIASFQSATSAFGNLSQSRGPRYSRSMSISGTKRSRKMVTIHNLNEMKAAVQENDAQTKMLVLGLGEAILTTCGMARAFLGNSPSDGDESKSTS